MGVVGTGLLWARGSQYPAWVTVDVWLLGLGLLFSSDSWCDGLLSPLTC